MNRAHASKGLEACFYKAEMLRRGGVAAYADFLFNEAVAIQPNRHRRTLRVLALAYGFGKHLMTDAGSWKEFRKDLIWEDECPPEEVPFNDIFCWVVLRIFPDAAEKPENFKSYVLLLHYLALTGCRRADAYTVLGAPIIMSDPRWRKSRRSSQEQLRRSQASSLLASRFVIPGDHASAEGSSAFSDSPETQR
ncbi:hypothetical protein [Terrihabitans rhizophilus]|uniref:Uncharacterized protein n=1 Tax=Terrihabitans rhizophilus TaxID=3092662 RepID=A0ABU4RRA0_9HYPH|nr:hypothetical protein [Terrihabitans sp. PJ23]MDX6806160.1 hypothetical protein [Terrihabitans sp. PJ23]